MDQQHDMWTLSILIPAKHTYANALLYSCYPFPSKKANVINVKTIINLSLLESELGCWPFCNYASTNCMC